MQKKAREGGHERSKSPAGTGTLWSSPATRSSSMDPDNTRRAPREDWLKARVPRGDSVIAEHCIMRANSRGPRFIGQYAVASRRNGEGGGRSERGSRWFATVCGRLLLCSREAVRFVVSLVFFCMPLVRELTWSRIFFSGPIFLSLRDCRSPFLSSKWKKSLEVFYKLFGEYNSYGTCKSWVYFEFNRSLLFLIREHAWWYMVVWEFLSVDISEFSVELLCNSNMSNLSCTLIRKILRSYKHVGL